MTKKQKELMNDMIKTLDFEFNYGKIGKKKFYSSKEAYELIGLNVDEFYGIVEKGECTPGQYRELTEIAGRTPKYDRHLIGFSQADQWIKKYKKLI